MKPLADYQLARLRLLAERPRAYTFRDNINPPLEKLGLVRPTGRADPIRQRREWDITEEGRTVLAQAEGAP